MEAKFTIAYAAANPTFPGYATTECISGTGSTMDTAPQPYSYNRPSRRKPSLSCSTSGRWPGCCFFDGITRFE